MKSTKETVAYERKENEREVWDETSTASPTHPTPMARSCWSYNRRLNVLLYKSMSTISQVLRDSELFDIPKSSSHEARCQDLNVCPNWAVVYVSRYTSHAWQRPTLIRSVNTCNATTTMSGNLSSSVTFSLYQPEEKFIPEVPQSCGGLDWRCLRYSTGCWQCDLFPVQILFPWALCWCEFLPLLRCPTDPRKWSDSTPCKKKANL